MICSPFLHPLLSSGRKVAKKEGEGVRKREGKVSRFRNCQIATAFKFAPGSCLALLKSRTQSAPRRNDRPDVRLHNRIQGLYVIFFITVACQPKLVAKRTDSKPRTRPCVFQRPMYVSLGARPSCISHCILLYFEKLHQHTAYREQSGTGDGFGGTGWRASVCAGKDHSSLSRGS